MNRTRGTLSTFFVLGLMALALCAFDFYEIDDKGQYEGDLWCSVSNEGFTSVLFITIDGEVIADVDNGAYSTARENFSRSKRQVKRFKKKKRKATSKIRKRRFAKRLRRWRPVNRDNRSIYRSLNQCLYGDPTLSGQFVPAVAPTPTPTPITGPVFPEFPNPTPEVIPTFTPTPTPVPTSDVRPNEVPTSLYRDLLGGVILAEDGTYLGIVDGNTFNSDSICNPYGTHGSKFSFDSIFNRFGSYGSEFGSMSAFNKFAIDPPIIFVGSTPIAFLTLNQYIGNTWVDADRLTAWLGCPRDWS